MQFKFASCRCITDDMVAALREDPTGLSPCVAACLRCMPVTCRGVPVDTINQPPLNPEPGTTIGQLLTDAWCTANGMIRARGAKGTDTLLLLQPTARERYILRITEQGRFLIWENRDNQEDVQQRLSTLPAGVDSTIVGEAVYTMYVVRQIDGMLCVLNPDSRIAWPDRQINPDDRFVLFGNENIRVDIRLGCRLRTPQTPENHDAIFLHQRAMLQAECPQIMGVQRVLRLR